MFIVEIKLTIYVSNFLISKSVHRIKFCIKYLGEQEWKRKIIFFKFRSNLLYYQSKIAACWCDGASGSTTLTSYLEPRALKIEVRIFICGEWCGYQVKWLSGGWPLWFYCQQKSQSTSYLWIQKYFQIPINIGHFGLDNQNFVCSMLGWPSRAPNLICSWCKMLSKIWNTCKKSCFLEHLVCF